MPHFLLIFRRIVIYAIKQIVAVTISNIDILHNKSIFTSLEVNAAVYQTKLKLPSNAILNIIPFDTTLAVGTLMHILEILSYLDINQLNG